VREFLQLSFNGLALGTQYALVALGFVIIYKATGVINFAQGGFVLLGGYLTYNFHVTWDLPFPVAVLFERLVLRRMIGQPPFAIIMITIGVLIVITQLVSRIWGFTDLNLGDPWGNTTLKSGDLVFSHVRLWTIGITSAVLAAFFAFFRFSSLGVAMRATALDQEAALAQGISARRVFAVSWGIAGAVAALAGVTLGSGSTALSLQIGFIALAAFPAMILGGLDSPGGAVVGGLIIGLTQVLTAGYQPDYFEWAGENFHVVMPYLVMIVVLLVRPYGLFGTPEVKRV
jgi:branched-chain amino acid transport system permease protein